MLEELITKNLVDTLPISRDQALLVEVNEIALDLLRGWVNLDSIHQVVADLITLDLF